MADSFRSELNSSLWMVHWIIRLVWLQEDHYHQTDRCVISKFCKSYREQMAPCAFESQYFDVVHRCFKSNTSGQWFKAPNGSSNSFKRCIKKWNATFCCSETNSSALSLYFHWLTHPPTSTHYYESTSPPEVWDLLVSDASSYHHREAQNHSPEHSRSPFLADGMIFPPLSGMLDPCQPSSNNWKLISFNTTWFHHIKKKHLFPFFYIFIFLFTFLPFPC